MPTLGTQETLHGGKFGEGKADETTTNAGEKRAVENGGRTTIDETELKG